MYPQCIHDNINRESYKEHNITYGEMDYDGINTLYNYIIRKQPQIRSFLDVGSGRGKLCMYMANYPQIKYSLGIEIVPERHQDAALLLRSTSSKFSRKIELHNNNILQMDIRSKFSEEYSPVFIWWSNLCFSGPVAEQIFQKLRDELPSGSVLCCSQVCKTHEPNDKINIPMSWNSTSAVSIYYL
jgi:hypothetical protein